MENEAVFKLGDVVWVKSGSPAMTVVSGNEQTADPFTIIKCVWYQQGTFQEGTFPAFILVKETPTY